MAKHMTPEVAVAWAEKILGPRGNAVITYKERNLMRRWIMGKLKCDYASIMNVPIPEMGKLYNDATDAYLNVLAEQIKVAPVAPKTVASLGENTEAPTVEAQVKANETLSKGKQTPVGTSLDAVIDARIDARMEGFKPGLDVEAVERIARQEAEKVKAPTQTVVITEKADGTKTEKNMGTQHYKFPLLLKCLDSGLNVALVGPAGSGKTTAVEKCADALGLPFEFTGACVMPSSLTGFITATGTLADTPFYRAFVRGGVHLFDEMDSWEAPALLAANAALANGHASFPDGLKRKHETFRAVAAMNTFGMGANRQYVGRKQLDAASVDRFVFMEWPIDVALEASFIGVKLPQQSFNIAEGGSLSPDRWMERVNSVRQAIDKLAIRHLVTPRATIYGAALLAKGVGLTHVEDMVLWKGLDAEQKARIIKEAR